MTGILAVNVAVRDRGRLLLVQREDFEVWCLPGGQVDPGESLADAADREVREETGLEVTSTDVVGAYSRPHWHGGIYVILFTAELTGGEMRPDPVEVVDIGWFVPDELPRPLLAGQRERIEDALAGRLGLSRSSNARSPFASREEAYRRRDESGLARRMFYERYLAGEEA